MAWSHRYNRGVLLNTQRQREQLLHRGGLHFYHWIVVGLSIAVTVGAWWFSSRQLEERVQARFERECSQLVELVSERMKNYEDGLWGGVAMLKTHDNRVELSTFRAFADSLNMEAKYPGIAGVGVIERVSAAEVTSYLDRRRAEYPSFEIHPPMDAAILYPISLVEPLAKNLRAVGLDVGHERNRLAAIEKARDTGLAQITGPIILVQDAGNTPGFLFYAPYYSAPSNSIDTRRERFLGAVYAPFVVRELMEGTLEREKRHVTFSISDRETVLYDEHLSGTDVDPDPLFRTVIDVPLYGRTWRFEIRSNVSFRKAAANQQPLTILVAGMAIDVLLLLFFVTLARANQKAVAYADDLTQELRKKAATLARSNRDLEQLSYLASHDLKSPLRGIRSLVSFVQEDMGDALDAGSAQHLTKAQELSDQMNRMLDELLQYANTVNDESGGEVRSVTIAELVEDICRFNGIDSDAVERQGYEGPLRLNAFAFRGILNNLLTNAIKHGTHAGERPRCIVECTPHERSVSLCVRDFGPGVPPGKEEEIFEIFRQLQPRRLAQGNGLGLAVVKRLVTNAGGRVWVESPPDGGAMFCVEWPLS